MGTSTAAVLAFTLTAALAARAQDLARARHDVSVLTSRDFYGRGYLRDGMAKASTYLTHELALAGLKPLAGDNYLQFFNHSINTFPGKVDVRVNGRKLLAGIDFLVTADSTGRKAQLALTPDAGTPEKPEKDLYSSADRSARVRLVDKLTFAARQKERVQPWTEIQLDRHRFSELPLNIDLEIENRVVDHFATANVAAIVPGTEHPERYLVLSAHYDHLGGLGDEAYFPGANDNASGTAFLLDLARYYQKHPARESVVFLFFASEEAGLIGSRYFVEHPLIPLESIHFLTNFDMVGTGDGGITAVNATVFKEQFRALNEAGVEAHAFDHVNERGESQASDHWSFYQKKVPCFFLYTMGERLSYHDVLDTGETLPFYKYESLFRMVLGFQDRLMASSTNPVERVPTRRTR